MNEAVQKAFEDAQQLPYQAVMIIGLTDKGGVSINSSIDNVASLQWMLAKSTFQINLFEHNAIMAEQAKEAAEEEATE